MKNKNGFTLIELLAVIVILAIIALIATPIVLNLIEQAREGAAKSSATSYVKAVETYLITSELDSSLEKPNANTEYDVSKINDLVELKGTKPTSGTVTISDKSTVATAEIVVNGYTVKYNGRDYSIDSKKENDNFHSKNEALVNDVNNNGKADIGDEIKVNGEHFYVIKNDGTTIKALAKYNLNVGSNKVASEPEGKQSVLATGWIAGGNNPYPGAVAFSNTNGWPYSNNDDIDIQIYDGPGKTAINNYKTVVTDATDVRLITKTELEELGCSTSNLTCNGAPMWVYSTTYWTGAAKSDNAKHVWRVESNGNFASVGFNNVEYFGIRPVITISKSVFNI